MGALIIPAGFAWVGAIDACRDAGHSNRDGCVLLCLTCGSLVPADVTATSNHLAWDEALSKWVEKAKP